MEHALRRAAGAKTYLLVLALTMLALAAAPALASAQEEQLHRYIGTAYLNGTPAPPGTAVSALNSAGTLATAKVTSTGLYILAVPKPTGDQLLFFAIAGALTGQNATWTAPGVTNLDLRMQSATTPTRNAPAAAAAPQASQETPGADGRPGPAGADGADGADGAHGADGRNGIDGQNGTDGEDGADGSTGPAGPQGPPGERGPQGPPSNAATGTTGLQVQATGNNMIAIIMAAVAMAMGAGALFVSLRR